MTEIGKKRNDYSTYREVARAWYTVVNINTSVMIRFDFLFKARLLFLLPFLLLLQLLLRLFLLLALL